MKTTSIMRKLFPAWKPDPIDSAIAELLKYDRPIEKAKAVLQQAEANYKRNVADQVSSAGEVRDSDEASNLAEARRRLALLEQVFSEKRSETARLVAAGSPDRKRRQEKIREALGDLVRERRTALIKAVLDFCVTHDVDIREIKFPSRHIQGGMPIPAFPSIGEPDQEEFETLRREAMKIPVSPLPREKEEKALRDELQKLSWQEIKPPEEAVDVLLAHARKAK